MEVSPRHGCRQNRRGLIPFQADAVLFAIVHRFQILLLLFFNRILSGIKFFLCILDRNHLMRRVEEVLKLRAMLGHIIGPSQYDLRGRVLIPTR